MKINTSTHQQLATKITVFSTGFLGIFFIIFLLFYSAYLIKREGDILKGISSISSPAIDHRDDIVIGAVQNTQYIPIQASIEGTIVDTYTTGSEVQVMHSYGNIEPNYTRETLLGGGVIGYAGYTYDPQRVFELTRDSLIQTQDGQIIRNGIFYYDAFDIVGILGASDGIFIDKTHGKEYYLFYKTKIGSNTHIFAQNITYIIMLVSLSVVICMIFLILFACILFFLSRYLITIVMRPIQENNIRLKEYNHNLAHEVKTPLTVIIMALQAIENNQNKKNIESIEQEVFKIKNIIDSLLFMSENLVIKEKVTISVSKSIERYIACHEASESIVYHTHPNTIDIIGDSTLWDRLIKNLIENGIKYSSDGRVVVTLKKDKILITNNVEHNIDTSRLCDMFYQGDNSRSSQGYGLGLALVKRISDISGWTIDIHCKNKIFQVSVTFG